MGGFLLLLVTIVAAVSPPVVWKRWIIGLGVFNLAVGLWNLAGGWGWQGLGLPVAMWLVNLGLGVAIIRYRAWRDRRRAALIDRTP